MESEETQMNIDEILNMIDDMPVSYTHLTLPTIA